MWYALINAISDIQLEYYERKLICYKKKQTV